MKNLQFSARPFLSAETGGAGGAAEAGFGEGPVPGGAVPRPDVSGHTGEDGPSAETAPETTSGTAAGDPGPGPEPGPEEEFDEIERGGTRYRVPKALSGELMMHADYTRKTQDVARQRQELEAARQSFVQQAQSRQAHIREVAKLHAIDETLERYRGMDWQKLETEDPAAAQSQWRQYMTLKDQRAELDRSLSDKVQQQSLERQHLYARQVQDTQAAITDPKTGIRGWGPELAREMTGYGAAQGLTAEDFHNINADPRAIRLLHKAMLWDQHDAKQAAAAKPPAPPAAHPVTTVGKGSAPAARRPEEMSTAEWMAWRAKQTRRR